MDNKTLKFSNLDALNDKHEAKRKDIEQFAKRVFVSCFCNYQYEVVPFWYNYGKSENKNKILLEIKNFSGDFESCFFTNFFITGEIPPRRMAFEPDIWSVQIADVLYKPIMHRVFQSNYAAPATLSSPNNLQTQPTGIIYDLTLLGKYKTIHWKYERETRIICIMGLHHEPFYERMFLTLKDNFFRCMEIVLNPWCSDEFANRVSEYLVQSSLPKEIKNTINISKSELNGLL
jgi:hypothetical protein